MKILVIEDNESLQSSFRMVFDHLFPKSDHGNLEIIFVEDLKSAINELKKRKFEVISSDGTFPDFQGGPTNRIAGLTLLRMLNDLSHAGHTIFYSSSTDQVREAATMVVAGRLVLSYEKSGGKGLTGMAWAKLCVSLARNLQPSLV